MKRGQIFQKFNFQSHGNTNRAETCKNEEKQINKKPNLSKQIFVKHGAIYSKNPVPRSPRKGRLAVSTASSSAKRAP